VVSLADPYLNTKLPGWPYDPGKARSLLKAAKAEGLEIEIRCSSDPDVVSTLLVLKKSLDDVGFRTTLRCLEFATFFSEVQKGNFEMYYLRWTGLTQPVLLNRIYHTREFPPGRNRVFYSNPTLDALLDQGESEADYKKRREIYNRVQRIVFDELPAVPLWYPDNVAVYTNKLKGFELHPSGAWSPLWKAHKE
jgi:peptide/nickel transport system substrate-binding protein